LRIGYLARTILFAIPTLLALITITFALIRLLPGDPILNLLGENFDPVTYAALLKDYGLDQPIYVQYLRWLWDLLHGDMGVSIVSHQPVTNIVLTRLPISLELAFLAVLIGVAIGIPTGIVSSTHRNTKTDYTVLTAAMVGLSIPEFFMAILLILGFGLYLRILPATGFVYFGVDPIGNLLHMILPAFALGIARAASIARLTRSSMLEVLPQDYVRTARSKGVKERTVIWRHSLRNALLPTVTLMGLQFGYILGAAVVIEIIFGIPGLASVGINAIQQRDYPVVQGFILVFGAMFILLNVLVDIVYTFLDPRIKV